MRKKNLSLEEFGAILETDLQRRDGALALDDDMLSDISGGQRTLFEGDGLNRHSWFVSLLSRWMAKEQGHGVDLDSNNLPGTISVDGTTYQIIRDGENIYVDEVR